MPQEESRSTDRHFKGWADGMKRSVGLGRFILSCPLHPFLPFLSWAHCGRGRREYGQNEEVISIIRGTCNPSPSIPSCRCIDVSFSSSSFSLGREQRPAFDFLSCFLSSPFCMRVCPLDFGHVLSSVFFREAEGRIKEGCTQLKQEDKKRKSASVDGAKSFLSFVRFFHFSPQFPVQNSFLLFILQRKMKEGTKGSFTLSSVRQSRLLSRLIRSTTRPNRQTTQPRRASCKAVGVFVPKFFSSPVCVSADVHPCVFSLLP
mmetsp:Transcript_1409/g.2877  ORF Transcript_1409/g.2877 Transcript_1409/m.2877 type:complete len:260 (-) Transcript_1409:4329-5108(-)